MFLFFLVRAGYKDDDQLHMENLFFPDPKHINSTYFKVERLTKGK